MYSERGKTPKLWPSGPLHCSVRFIMKIKGRINNNAVCVWMALLNGLKTKVLLASRNIMTDTVCILCNSSQEDSIHLFTQCSYSLSVWNSIASKFGVNYQTGNTLNEMMSFFLLNCDTTREGNFNSWKVLLHCLYLEHLEGKRP